MRIDPMSVASGTSVASGRGTEPAIAGAWEACAGFAADGPGSPVCEGCGWLLDDHGETAVVRQLPARAPRSARPQRLAS